MGWSIEVSSPDMLPKVVEINANFPGSLVPTDVTPGAYTNPRLVINGFGQITGAENGTDTFNSMADLRSYQGPGGSIDNLENGHTVKLTGYYDVDDGGHGSFVWADSDSRDDNGGTVVKPFVVSGSGRWIRTIDNGEMSLKAWGAPMDDSENDSPYFQAALDDMMVTGNKLFIPEGDVSIEDNVSYIGTGICGGPFIRGSGIRKTFLHWRTPGASMLRTGNTVPAKFCQGLTISDFTIDCRPKDGDPAFPFHSMLAALEVPNVWMGKIERVEIDDCRGHGIWAPTRWTSTDISISPDSAKRPNDKPWVLCESETGNMAQLLAHVDSGTGEVQGIFIMRKGFGYEIGDVVRCIGSGTACSASVTAVDSVGGITAVTVTDGGSGWDVDRLNNSPDSFTSVLEYSNLIITHNDGIGVIMPHFSSGGIFSNCYVVANKGGGYLIGGNTSRIYGGACASNGIEHPSAGLFPGIWLRRGWSSPNCFQLEQVELDGNGYAHILFNGTSEALVQNTRMNSWVTNNSYAPRRGQFPAVQVRFEKAGIPAIGDTANNFIDIKDTVHRSQPNGGSVANFAVVTTAGNQVISFGALDVFANFLAGVTVKLVVDGEPQLFENDETTTTVVSVDPEAGIVTLASAPSISNSAEAGARLIEEIGDNACMWFDFGRTISNSCITVTNATPSTTSGIDIPYGNIHETRISALIDIRDKFLDRPQMIAGNNSAIARIDAGSTTVEVPVQSGGVRGVDIPFNNALEDVWSKLQTEDDVTTGWYRVSGTGTYSATGRITIASTVVSDVVSVQMNARLVTLESDGSETPWDETQDVIVDEIRHICKGSGAESIPFDLKSFLTVYKPFYSGSENQPPPSPLESQLWFNTTTKILQRWNGSSWDVMSGYDSPYTPAIYLSIKVGMIVGGIKYLNAASNHFNKVLWLQST